MLDEERENVSLVWLPGHEGITGNIMADMEAKTALDDVILKCIHHKTWPNGSRPKSY
jgi:ribonuclease HI